jgi:hypothetical protein
MKREIQFELVRKDAKAHRVYGWANVVEKDGEVVIDKHGDMITADDLEDAAADFVKHYRQGGEDHEGLARNILVTSIVMTHDVQKALGLSDSPLPVGWFVGFELTAESYGKVEKGEKLMFSIEGEAETEEVEV